MGVKFHLLEEMYKSYQRPLQTAASSQKVTDTRDKHKTNSSFNSQLTGIISVPKQTKIDILNILFQYFKHTAKKSEILV